jgi:small subunit ribosomal protein S17|tara:strand:- start:64 stop:312 length:249 start_codon:yes stop_codon:yes gene_type:complete
MSNQKIRTGEVISNKMDETAIVSVSRQYKHKLYGKYIKRFKKYVAHDPANKATIGSVVKIKEVRPLSKTKRWIITEIQDKIN